MWPGNNFQADKTLRKPLIMPLKFFFLENGLLNAIFLSKVEANRSIFGTYWIA